MMESIANFIGREGFNWWVGQVENDGAKFWNAELDGGTGDFDYGDWDWTNKVKVRIIGYHNPNRKELPTSDLPWAQVLMPIIFHLSNPPIEPLSTYKISDVFVHDSTPSESVNKVILVVILS